MGMLRRDTPDHDLHAQPSHAAPLTVDFNVAVGAHNVYNVLKHGILTLILYDAPYQPNRRFV